ncbi:dermonecrotic toxin domain-containing protein [Pseudomonas reactans]|uniref:dermonecrotic toxin domain-containing protein n=1 Tax=Pseudomonas reactans TaxID=117680 RepID=UPI0015A2BAD9|nr:DUF6543 domain-containing protein [Pseudomonas reactans]NWA65676.1 hypothetical protein [Pseudomonas reactans]
MTLHASIEFVRLRPPLSQNKLSNDVQEHLPASPGRPTEFYTVVSPPQNSTDVERFVKNAAQQMLTPAQETSKIIAGALHKKFNLTLDPDTTYIVTTNYDLSKPAPPNGKILNKISLTNAALANEQDINKKDETLPAQSHLKIFLHSTIGGILIYDKIKQIFDPDPAYEYIVRGTSSAPDLSSKVPLTPQHFRDLVWDTALVAPYKEYLDNFWSTHEKKYEHLSKIAFAQAAYTQTQEGSLSEQDAQLVMRAAGLPPGKPWLETSVKNLEATYTRDPSLEVGLLSINGNQSTDLLYVIDKKVRLDAEGKEIRTTLLHIPGNSSPIQRFDSPEEMKTWLADQAADPVKRAALLIHFKGNDQDNGFFSDGVEQSLKGLGGWTESQKPNWLGFTGFSAWDPQRYITLEPVNGGPFKTLTQRQKERSYADADHDITTDGDVTKATVIKVTETATAAALMMTPLAFVMPEVGVALDVIYVGAGLTQVGVGIDDLTHGKSSGTDRLVFGVLNAVPGITGGASPLGKGAETVETAITESTPEAAAPEPQIQAPQVIPRTTDILAPEAFDISEHAVPNGEQLIEGAAHNAHGIYQVKDGAGTDRWFIRYPDSTAESSVYEIKSTFKPSDRYVQIIDPETREQVLFASQTNKSDWVPIKAPEGITLPWESNTALAKRNLKEAIKQINQDKRTFSTAEREQALNEMTRLIQNSKAENYESIEEYTEAGSDEINSELRTKTDPSHCSPNVKEFLSDLDAQADYSGKGYRYAFVTSDGTSKLKSGVGKVFSDPGVQSASTQPVNAKEWETWAENIVPPEGQTPVIYVFDESISKKNLSTDTLPDHIAITPNTLLEVRATKEQDGILYVYFEAPTKLPKQHYNLFNGSIARPH